MNFFDHSSLRNVMAAGSGSVPECILQKVRDRSGDLFVALRPAHGSPRADDEVEWRPALPAGESSEAHGYVRGEPLGTDAVLAWAVLRRKIQ
jgi:hypothetical protein